ncbi:hypothetical protein F4604DRAFT_1931047 [Suillus subluteus]|nr:hypothetical protein F4604DRAFT_1931047 [Suillus subluteus]
MTRWVVIGGQDPGIKEHHPNINNSGLHSPPFPIIIKCSNEAQALIINELQSIMSDLTQLTPATNAARAFSTSAVAKNTLKTLSSYFPQITRCYSVVSGHQTGIFLSWPDCKQAVDGYRSAIYIKFTCFSTAMAWLILRGEEDLNISANINKVPTNSSSDDSDDTDTSFTVVKAQHGLSSLTLTDHSQTLSSTLSTISSLTLSTSSSSHSTFYTQRSPTREVERPVHQFIRELRCITGIIYERPADEDNTLIPSFGDLADAYIYAHGFTHRAILGIQHAYDMASTCRDFVGILIGKGMPWTEATFLWHLITGIKDDSEDDAD